MKNMKKRKKSKSRIRPKQQEISSKFNIKLFITLGLLLVILLMKKYSLSIGNFDVDSIYNVVYYNEDINTLKNKIFFLKKSTDDQIDTMETIDQIIDEEDKIETDTVDN